MCEPAGDKFLPQVRLSSRSFPAFKNNLREILRLGQEDNGETLDSCTQRGAAVTFQYQSPGSKPPDTPCGGGQVGPINVTLCPYAARLTSVTRHEREGNDPQSAPMSGLASSPPRGVWESEMWQLERNGNLINCGSTPVGTVCRVSSSRWVQKPTYPPYQMFPSKNGPSRLLSLPRCPAVAPPYCTGAPCQEALQNRSSLGPFTTPAAANAVRCPIRVLLLHALALRLARAPRDRKRADGVGPARENASAFDRLDWTDEGRRAGALHHLFLML
ncbi:hypothetical protein V8E53_010071 [Lactarius tabidus]